MENNQQYYLKYLKYKKKYLELKDNNYNQIGGNILCKFPWVVKKLNMHCTNLGELKKISLKDFIIIRTLGAGTAKITFLATVDTDNFYVSRGTDVILALGTPTIQAFTLDIPNNIDNTGNIDTSILRIYEGVKSEAVSSANCPKSIYNNKCYGWFKDSALEFLNKVRELDIFNLKTDYTNKNTHSSIRRYLHWLNRNRIQHNLYFNIFEANIITLREFFNTENRNNRLRVYGGRIIKELVFAMYNYTKKKMTHADFKDDNVMLKSFLPPPNNKPWINIIDLSGIIKCTKKCELTTYGNTLEGGPFEGQTVQDPNSQDYIYNPYPLNFIEKQNQRNLKRIISDILKIDNDYNRGIDIYFNNKTVRQLLKNLYDSRNGINNDNYNQNALKQLYEEFKKNNISLTIN